MNLLTYILIFFIGLCVGSFINVLVMRLDRKDGLWTGRSECPSCHHKLSWLDLMPVISYLFLKGKCRYCRSKISAIYPIVEIATSSVFVVYFWVNGFFFDLGVIYELTIMFLLISLVFFDFEYLILPDKIIFSGIGLSILRLMFLGGGFLNYIITGFVMAGFFGIIYLVSHGEWMGFGDVKLALLIGLIFGYPVAIFSMIGAVWMGAILGLMLMFLGRAGLKTALPFGSFISGVAIITIIFSDYVATILSNL